MIQDKMTLENVIGFLASTLNQERERREDAVRGQSEANVSYNAERKETKRQGDVISKQREELHNVRHELVVIKAEQKKDRNTIDELFTDYHKKLNSILPVQYHDAGLSLVSVKLDTVIEIVRNRIEEAGSYKKLYNELKRAVMQMSIERTGYAPTENPKPKEVLEAVENQRKDYVDLETKVERLTAAPQKSEHWRLKYKRLTSMIRRSPDNKAKYVLFQHQDLERKRK